MVQFLNDYLFQAQRKQSFIDSAVNEVGSIVKQNWVAKSLENRKIKYNNYLSPPLYSKYTSSESV